ncbi:MAG: hypothetical protein ACK41T_10585 [Pseudobdellovibrio sp.]
METILKRVGHLSPKIILTLYFSCVVILFFSLNSCSVYRSAERTAFESESPSALIKSANKISCSGETVATHANQSRLLTQIDEEFLWEHKIQNNTIYESTDLKGTYCLYDVEYQ